MPLRYKNTFRCIPDAPFPSARSAPRPSRRSAAPKRRSSSGRRAAKSPPTNTAASKCSSSGTATDQKNLDSSCWVRVAQAWAGKSFGAFFLPRVGDEVHRRFSRRRSRSADHRRLRLQRQQHAGLHFARQQNPQLRQDPQQRNRERPTISTNCGSRTRRTAKKSTSTPKRTSIGSSRTTTRLKVGFDKKDKGDQTIDIYNDRTTTLDQGNETLTVKTGTRTVTIAERRHPRRSRTARGSSPCKTTTRTPSRQGNLSVTVNQGNVSLTVDTGNVSYTISAGKCTIEAAAVDRVEGRIGESIKLTPTGMTHPIDDDQSLRQGMTQVRGARSKSRETAMVDIQRSDRIARIRLGRARLMRSRRIRFNSNHINSPSWQSFSM